MRYKIVAIKDRAVDVFSIPQFVPAVGAAIRSFGDECKKKDTPLGQHPDDYDLYSLGEYDDETGTFDGTLPQVIARGKDYLEV